MIPGSVPTSMVYSSKKNKGLGIFRATWEAYVQNYNSLRILSNTQDEIIQNLKIFSLNFEIIHTKLELPQAFISELENCLGKPARKIRDFLKNREFENWTNYSFKGKGVILFKEVTYTNKWLFNKLGLTCNEFTTMLRMIAETTTVRYQPGRSQDDTRCRFCGETETLAHVLGKCHRGELLRHARHNKVVQLLATALRQLGWDVRVELHCETTHGENKRVDILAIDPRSNNAFIIDPTIRMEKSAEQPLEVDTEKKRHYEPCTPFFQNLYGLNDIEVIGLMVGARGTITSFFENFRKRFKIEKSVIEEIVINVIRGSVQIYNNHVYNNNNNDFN